MIGAFSLETIVTDELEFKVFEISASIVAGTNLYIRRLSLFRFHRAGTL